MLGSKTQAFYCLCIVLALTQTGFSAESEPRQEQISLISLQESDDDDDDEVSLFDDSIWVDYCLSSSWTQSPVQISAPFEYIDYDPEFTFTLQNDGEWTVQDELLTLVNDWGTIVSEGRTYVIYEIRMTSPSEHTIGTSGYRYDLEMQTIAIAEDGSYLGLITFFEEGEASDFLTGVGFSTDSGLKDLDEGSTLSVSEYYSLSWLFEDGMKLFYYDGSLTWPPCNEILWVIDYKVHTASAEQIRQFPDALEYYIRDTQSTDSTYDYTIYVNFDMSVSSSSSSSSDSEINYQVNEEIELNKIKDSDYYDNTDRYIIFDEILTVGDLIMTVTGYEDFSDAQREVDAEEDLDDDLDFTSSDDEDEDDEDDDEDDEDEDDDENELLSGISSLDDMRAMEGQSEIEKVANDLLKEKGTNLNYNDLMELKKEMNQKGFSFLEVGKMKVGAQISELNRNALYELREALEKEEAESA